ncbi:DNA mismatch repair protein MutS [Parasedimentitalea marina]|uniref:DNA mismatch repair protein MutS n=1 Tax=Parasedimentitalea marina TaxID=2483033 RepID=A0A3T0N7U2_9RHOB|nr:Smr/MutS family protein [Parasedimentitalea marina]AZV80077.1 DNA mismatch repair protein MutS [Parasedimentitalea marina]
MTRRKLTADEIDLWQEVVKKTERLHHSAHKAAPALPLPKPKPIKHPVPHIDSFELGSRSRQKPVKHDLKPAITDRLFRAPVQMDQKAFTRMTRGKLKPEGKLDLHGMRIDSAHPALIRFILSAQASGKRLVLVVTGKGKDRDEPGPIPTPRGVLRHQVPHWLALPPLAQGVLQVTPAHISHGGSGAYYVYLRRTR